MIPVLVMNKRKWMCTRVFMERMMILHSCVTLGHPCLCFNFCTKCSNRKHRQSARYNHSHKCRNLQKIEVPCQQRNSTEQDVLLHMLCSLVLNYALYYTHSMLNGFICLAVTLKMNSLQFFPYFCKEKKMCERQMNMPLNCLVPVWIFILALSPLIHTSPHMWHSYELCTWGVFPDHMTFLVISGNYSSCNHIPQAVTVSAG